MCIRDSDITLIANILNIVLLLLLILIGKKLKDIEDYYVLAQSILMKMLRTLVILNNLLRTVREAVSDGRIEEKEAEKITKLIEEIISIWDSTEAPQQDQDQETILPIDSLEVG